MTGFFEPTVNWSKESSEPITWIADYVDVKTTFMTPPVHRPNAEGVKTSKG